MKPITKGAVVGVGLAIAFGCCAYADDAARMWIVGFEFSQRGLAGRFRVNESARSLDFYVQAPPLGDWGATGRRIAANACKMAEAMPTEVPWTIRVWMPKASNPNEKPTKPIEKEDIAGTCQTK